MSSVRSTLIFSISVVLSVAMVILFMHYKDRFIMLNQGAGLYIFDRKMNSLSYCDNSGCRLVSVQGEQMAAIHPAAMITPQHPPVQQLGFVNPAQMQQMAQQQANPGGVYQTAQANPQAALLQAQQARQAQALALYQQQQRAATQAALYRQQQAAAAARLQPTAARQPQAAAEETASEGDAKEGTTDEAEAEQ